MEKVLQEIRISRLTTLCLDLWDNYNAFNTIHFLVHYKLLFCNLCVLVLSKYLEQ